MAVTTYLNGTALTPPMKPFAWSYSKLKNFEVCPKRHYHVDIAKDFKEAEGDALLWGNQVHKAAANRLGKNIPLPTGYDMLVPWCDRLVTSPGKLSVELQLAIDKDFGPVPWFDKRAWFRAVVDVLLINGAVGLAIDWKTGKIIEDSVQLALIAACTFAHYPELKAVRSEFIWLKEDATTREDFMREDIPRLWQLLWPRIEQLENAYLNTTYPAKKGGLCKRYCPVTSCPHHGV